MEPPTSGTNLPISGVRLLKRPTTNGSGGESSLHAVSSRGLGESGMSSKIGAPIIRRVPAKPTTAAVHQRPRELDKTGSTGQTRSQVVTEPSAATATPHNRTEESLDLTSHQLWPSISGAAGTESGCGQEAWPSISSKGWSSVVKSAPSGKTPPLRRGPATVRRATGNDSSEGEEDEPQVNGKQKQTKRKKKKKKAGDSQPTPQAKKLDHPPQLNIFEYAKKAPVRPILNKKDTVKPSKDAPALRNMLDSTAPATRRGKEREQPKAKKPTYIRKIIDKEKAVKKELRAKGLAIPPDLDVVTQESNQSDQGVVSADDASGEQPTTPTNQSPVATPTNQLPVTTPTNQFPVTTPTITDTTAHFTTHTPHLSHTHPALPTVATTATRQIHGRRFREYCSHMVTDEINTAVNLLLQDLVRFQDRVYQKDPSLLKRKRRYVCGLREVYKHLEVGKLKCVIIAPNLDHIQSTGGIDERVTAILSLCQQKKVQVVYAMSRRRLAVVLKKKFKIGCVGIFSYDGAESHYSKLLQLVEDATKLYERIAHPQSPSSPVQDDSSPLFDPLKSESDCDHSGAEEGPVLEPRNEIGTQKRSTDTLWDKYLPKREMSNGVHHTSRCSNDDVAAISTNHIAAVEDDVTSQRSVAGANISDSTSHSTSVQESRNVNSVTLHEHNDFATLSTNSYQRFQWNIEAAEFIPSQNMPWSSSSSPHVTV